MSSDKLNLTSGRRRLTSTLGFALIGNLSLSVGLMPWLSMSAYGQASLLETNPAPQAPAFDIPSEVTPAPEAAAPAAPEPVYQAPEPEAYAAPEPPSVPEPAYESEPFAEIVPVEPSVEASPADEPPALPEIIAQPEPAQPLSTPAIGCAALLDPNAMPGASCGPSELEAEPVIPQPAAPLVVAEEELSTPPVRQVMPEVAKTVPPARRLTPSLTPIDRTAALSAKPVVPAYSAVVPPTSTYDSVVPPAPPVQSIASTNNITIPPAPQTVTTAPLQFTAVKPKRYGLKPLGRNPLQWVFGDRPMLFPLPFPVAVSSTFGWRQHPIQKNWHLHSGIDFAAPQGTPVLAAYDGQVAIANYVGGYGLSVLLDHQKGERQTRYAHLSEIYVRPGQKVSQGDVLGAVGSTGNSTGPHLHFETLIKTPNGMVVADPTKEVQIALVSALEHMQARVKQTPAASAKSSSAAVNQPPIPVEVIQPMSRYQANANVSQPYWSE